MMAQTQTVNSVDPAEVAHFAAHAGDWWDMQGKLRSLHQINAVRIGFVRDQVVARFGRDAQQPEPFKGLSLADIGCGGGLLSEPMRRLGADVTGIDAAAENIGAAKTHAAAMELEIDYRAMTAEALAAEGAQFDVVLALEIIEHVADVPSFLMTLTRLVKPGGLLFISTLNRTAKSFALAIVGAEYVLGWVPRGTHDWRKFLRPSEIIRPLEQQGLTLHDLQGMVYRPLKGSFTLSQKDWDVNYILAMGK